MVIGGGGFPELLPSFFIIGIYNYNNIEMIGSLNKLLRNVASIQGKSAFDKVRLREK